MKILANVKLVSLSMLVVVALAACDKSGSTATAGEKLNQAADKVAVISDDAGITTKVKAAIFAEPGLMTQSISVDTAAGVVTLSGSVDSLASQDRAKALAVAVAGVTGVENRLALKASN